MNRVHEGVHHRGCILLWTLFYVVEAGPSFPGKEKMCIRDRMNYLSVNAMEHFLNSFDKTDHKELRCFCIVLDVYKRQV